MAENQVAYCIQSTGLGRLLVAATARGVCFLGMGDKDEMLVSELSRAYPGAVPATPGSTCCKYTAQVAGWLGALLRGESPAGGFADLLAIPLAAAGTPFQQRVWAALRRIPAGQTLTYTQLAEVLHSPSGARAVAHACAANPVSILIPCHRMLRRDGSLGGYRWGLQRKRLLQTAEKSLVSTY